MNGRSLLFLFLFGLWSLLCGWYYTCKIRCQCDGEKTAVVEDKSTQQSKSVQEKTAVSSFAGPVNFKWSDYKATLDNSSFPDFKKSILKGYKDNNVLEVTGNYFAKESNQSKWSNLGLARAASFKSLLADKIDTARILTKSALLNGSIQNKDGWNNFIQYRWLIGNENIQEIDDKILIYFPSGSAEKETAPAIDEYLSDLAVNMKENQKWEITLVGHTDSEGDAANNMHLGRMRAESIRSILKKKGIAGNRVNPTSKGETEPMADNSTKEGRRKNRRTELIILK